MAPEATDADLKLLDLIFSPIVNFSSLFANTWSWSIFHPSLVLVQVHMCMQNIILFQQKNYQFTSENSVRTQNNNGFDHSTIKP